jgi:4,4'-diaponeurosporenoate glycosyltransferase
VLVPLIGWITGCFIVSVWLSWALVAGLPARGALGALYALHALQIFWTLRRLGNYGAATALFFPVPLVFFAAVFFLSLTRTHLLGRVRWKGRDISTQGG